ncbi:hypothetical protein HYR65_03070, partial [Candidatus Azambacteria bacterium]|nr:hypothetical protein [Candidatus Azambacteria bacterium]
ERKKKIVERVDGQIQALNQKMQSHFSDMLARLAAALDRVSERADKTAEKGVDVSSVRTAIAEAQSAIAASKAAIEAQVWKVYVASITTEDALRLEVGKTRQALRDDLHAVGEAIKRAHDAVKKAAVALAQVSKGQNDVTATTSTSTVQ